jgi:hypothetical protein
MMAMDNPVATRARITVARLQHRRLITRTTMSAGTKCSARSAKSETNRPARVLQTVIVLRQGRLTKRGWTAQTRRRGRQSEQGSGCRRPTHYQALRTLANRFVGILQGCLRTHTLYNEHLAWHNEPDKLSPAA